MDVEVNISKPKIMFFLLEMFDVRYTLCHIVRIPFFVPGVMDHMWELFLSCSLRLCVVCLYLTQNLCIYTLIFT